MATIGYTIQDNLYVLASDFDIPASMILKDMSNYADQISKNLNDGVYRTKPEILKIYADQLKDYATVSAKNFDLDADALNEILDALALSVDI